MIGKVPKAGRGFKGLISYLLHGDRSADPDAREGTKRVAWAETRNMLVPDPDLAPRLMRATAMKSRRVVSPVYHYVISWHPDEAPSDDLMRQVADTTCADLGLSDHQMLYVAHRDTDHHHVHIVANRVHPGTGTAWNRCQDWVKIEQSLRRQSESMGMDVVPGRHTEPDAFAEVAKRAGDGEVRLGKKFAPSHLDRHWTREMIRARRREFAEIFAKATSWDQLSRALDAKGCRLVQKGQGMVIADGQGVMKLSAVAKDVRQRLLEERFNETFGAFVTRNEPAQFEGGTLVAPPQAPVVHAPLVPPEATKSTPAPKPAARPDEDAARRSAKMSALQDAQAVVDLVAAFQKLGLSDSADLARALAERQAAGAELDKEKAVIDQLVADLEVPTKSRRSSDQKQNDSKAPEPLKAPLTRRRTPRP